MVKTEAAKVADTGDLITTEAAKVVHFRCTAEGRGMGKNQYSGLTYQRRPGEFSEGYEAGFKAGMRNAYKRMGDHFRKMGLEDK